MRYIYILNLAGLSGETTKRGPMFDQVGLDKDPAVM